LLNHDIHPNIEDKDIKRFKNEIAKYLNIQITYANMKDWDKKDQFDVCREIKAFKVGRGTELCTNRMKTAPFDKYLKENFPEKECVLYYGFDANETVRIQRRSSILGLQGYKTDYPLALWNNRTIWETEEIGIKPPGSYSVFKHANCIGCLKAGKQHWYVVFRKRPDIWEKAKDTEELIGYSIIKGTYLDELEKTFLKMKNLNIPASEKIKPQTFWATVKKQINDVDLCDDETNGKPCQCMF